MVVAAAAVPHAYSRSVLSEKVMREIAHIEFHDARVGQLSLVANGALRVGFEHICVYFRAAPEAFEVWSVRAVLQGEDVEALEVRGAFQADDYVSEGTILDEKGVEIAEVNAEGLGRARRLDLLFAGSGSEIHTSMGAARFVIDALVERLEDWNGPLVPQP
jgi:hypothetical protein